MKNKLYISLLVVSMFVACKTVKQTATPTVPVEGVATVCPKVRAAEPQFTTLNVSKMLMELVINGQVYQTHGSLRMLPDSMIMLSVQPLSGFELARVEFTPQKVVVINKLSQRYFESSYDYFRRFLQIPLSYELIQNLISRHLFVIGRDMEKCDYNEIFLLERKEENCLLTSTSGDGKIMHEFAIDPNYQIGQTEMVVYLEGSSTTVKYGKTSSANGVKYPETMEFSFKSRNVNVEGNVSVHKIAFNKELSIAASDLSRFERVILEQLFGK